MSCWTTQVLAASADTVDSVLVTVWLQKGCIYIQSLGPSVKLVAAAQSWQEGSEGE
jgi:hypothetical protein